MRFDDARNFRDRLDDADFVVCVHDADEDRAVVERGAECIEVDEAFTVHGEVRDAEAVLRERLALVEDGVMFDRGGDDVVAVSCGGLAVSCGDPVAAAAGGHGDGAEGEVVSFGAAAGEDDLVRLRAERFGDGAAGCVEALAGIAGLGVDAAGVTPGGREVRQHGRDHARVGRRRGGVIEVDAAVGHASMIAGL